MRARLTALVMAALLLTTFSVSGPLWADYGRSFGRGIQAMERDQWEEAARYFREATRERPEAGGPRVKIYGIRYEEYLPYYFLGLALFETGDMQGAAQAWQESEEQGAITASALFPDLQKRLSEAREQLATEEDQSSGLSPEEFLRYLGAAEAEIAGLEELMNLPPGVEARMNENPEMARSFRWVQETRKEAESQFHQGRKAEDLATILAARDLAMEARTELNRILRITEEELAAQEVKAPAAEPQEIPPPQPLPATESPQPRARPQALEMAARAYFDRDYQFAEKILSEAELDEPRAQALALVLRAAARHALYRLSGEEEDWLARIARQDLAEALLLDPETNPDPRYFPPSFVALSQEVKDSPEAP